MKLTETKAALAALYVELDAAYKKMQNGGLKEGEGDAIEQKAKEAETLQKEVDQADRIASLAAKAREVVDPALPATNANERKESKGRGAGVGADGSPILGYQTIGQSFVESKEFQDFIKAGAPKGMFSSPFSLPGLHEPVIALTQKMLERKANPTLDATVILPDRIAEVVRTTEHVRLRLRDVLQVSQTNSNAVQYIVINSYTEASAPVAAAAAKPEAAIDIQTATAPVRTMAVWMPITEQQLEDVPALRSMIDNELIYDLKHLEEKQIMWGSGSGENLQGILTLSGVPSITRTAPSATQNIDRIKIGATDVMIAGGEPNAVCVHPIDWEGIVLLKDTQNRYLWALIETVNGPRIWGMDVVETVAMQKPTTVLTTFERDLLVGDFVRGATLWDRTQASVAVGWINDQFTKNLRTIRAEERLAFGIKRPKFFRKYVTAAES